MRKRAITKTYLYNFDPLKLHFYIVKLGFTGVYIIFLISARNIDCGCSLEPSRRGGSNEYPQSMFWAETWKISEFFIWKFSFIGGKIFSMLEYSCFRNVRVNIVHSFKSGSTEQREKTYHLTYAPNRRFKIACDVWLETSLSTWRNFAS